MNFVEELKWRGMIADMMPGTEEQLQKEMTSAYVGIDPTADSLHIGHLVSVMMLKHFQRAGHRPIALVGGATGMIGDPSMKSAERNLLDEETLRHNQDCIKKQLAKFLDFDSEAPNAAKLVNNYDWMKNYSFLNFIRDIGKHITVNYMMAKDSVKKRLSRDSSVGMSFTEFSYQLVMSKEHPLANKDDIKLKDLSEYIEINHADPYVPSMPLVDVKKAELSEFVDKRIFIFERATQFRLLSEVPNTFMWVSPIPEKMLENYGLVSKSVKENNKVYKDVLIHRKNYKPTELDNIFITALCEEKRKFEK